MPFKFWPAERPLSLERSSAAEQLMCDDTGPSCSPVAAGGQCGQWPSCSVAGWWSLLGAGASCAWWRLVSWANSPVSATIPRHGEAEALSQTQETSSTSNRAIGFRRLLSFSSAVTTLGIIGQFRDCSSRPTRALIEPWAVFFSAGFEGSETRELYRYRFTMLNSSYIATYQNIRFK